MNNPIEITALVLIIANGLVSYKGMTERTFLDKYVFHVERILRYKEYYRLLSSGFLHGGWVHLFLNMYVLYVFAEIMGRYQLLSLFSFLLIYFGSLLGGNLLALYIHRHHGSYRALGASGAISGLVFAFIAMFPNVKLGLLFIPFFSLPGWIFGLIYLLVTLYGVRSRWGNIGHEAHLGGSIVGILFAPLIQPHILATHGWVLAVLLVPIALFLTLIILRPEFLLLNKGLFSWKPGKKNWGRKEGRIVPFQNKPEAPKLSKEEELNQLLDKVRKEGLEKLSAKERARLEALSKELE